MPGVLIDRKVLIQHKFDKLLSIAGSPPKTKDSIGIVFLMPKKQYNFLHNAQSGDEKIAYILS
jgi:hypothetical protein